MNIKIIVATDKEYSLMNKEPYLPVFCGSSTSQIKHNYLEDNEGENISNKNKYYCELTGLYWAWKNIEYDYLGLNHYRRYFKYGLNILDKAKAEKIFQKYQVILPKKRHYYIETVYSQFVHAHGKEAIETTRKVINKSYPDYLKTFDLCMNKRSFHNKNMFVMEKNIVNDYCEFLFNILFNIEKELQPSDRILGYIGERLLDVYIVKNNIKYKELYIETTEKIDWPNKIFDFIKRKMQYEKSN